MVLPSTAITLRPPMAPTRVRSQDAALASRSSAFTRSSTLRMVDSLGRAHPSSRSRAPRSAGSRSATCSRIAPSVRHPARTPTTARHPTAVRQWRTPRLSRGSSTPFRTSLRGWRDRAVVVDDDMAARPPGGEVDSSTTHRPGGAAPHPRQHADNPGHQTTSRRLCRDPGSGAPRSCDRSRRASPAPPAGRLFWGCLCGAGGAPGVTRGGVCPNLPQRRPAAGLAAKKSAEYQRFFLRVPARYGSLWQIWTIRRLRPRAGRHGPAFPRARRGRPGGRRPHGPHGSRGPAGPAGVPPLARHYADPDPRTTAFGREGPVSTGAARRGPLRSTSRTIRGRRERKPPQPPPRPRQPRITRTQTHPE